MTGVGTGLIGNNLTELPGGKNLSITAGINLDVYGRGPFRVGAEVRGTYPVSSGKVDDQRDVLGGIRIAYDRGSDRAIRPYIDGHFGRGQMNYVGSYLVGKLLYQQTASNVYGGGGGVEFDVTDQFSLKVDAQAHHWNTPVVLPNNSLWSAQASVGIAYRIFAGGGPR